jgi:DNA polymerase elongation subunit (family B)
VTVPSKHQPWPETFPETAEKRILVGSFDFETVGLDISDEDNRILSVSIYGDVYPDGIVVMYDEEEKTLDSFIKKAQKHDVLIGWNSDAFDVPALRARLLYHGVDPDQVELPLIIDAMRIHEHMLRKQETSYTLDHVSKKHLKEGKLPFDPGRTLETFKSNPEALATYNLQDSRLVWMLNQQFGYWETFNGIVTRSGLDEYNTRKFAGISMKENGGFAWWRPLMGLVAQYCKKNGRPVPEWPEDEEKSRRNLEKIERPGGFVETPTQGHHKNVVEFDFKSLYPTIIQSFNLGYDSADDNGEITPPFGRYHREPRSTIAAILDDLVVERSAVKKEYEDRKAEGATTEELAALKGRAEALKIFNNSFYGQFYAVFSPLYHYNSAKNITILGQECVQMMMNRMREMGLEVIAGDTDSTYVKVPPEMFNKAAALKFSAELTQHIAEKFKSKYDVDFVGSFDFKSLISNMAIFKKKFYARLELGKKISEIELKGYVRGTTPELQRVAQRRVFETMFEGGDVKAMLAEAKQRFMEKKDHTLLIHWMRAHNSTKNTAQSRAKRELQAAGVVFQKFDQVGFLILGTGKKQRRVYAHLLDDSTVEWLWDNDDTRTPHRNTDFLKPEEASKLWDTMVEKLDGVKT